jgi:hypothetical protein
MMVPPIFCVMCFAILSGSSRRRSISLVFAFAVLVYHFVFFILAQQHSFYALRICLGVKLRSEKVLVKTDSHQSAGQVYMRALFFKRQQSPCPVLQNAPYLG